MPTILLSLALLTWSEQLPAPATTISADHAARLYRIAVYDTYRLDRPEYNRRRELGNRVWASVQHEKAASDRRAEATAWFIAAREASLAGELPVLPEFAADMVEFQPVATSGQEDKISLEPSTTDTTLDVQLPKGAIATGQAPFFSRLIKSAFRALATDDVSTAKEPALNPPTARPAIDKTPVAPAPAALDVDALFEPATK